MSPRQPHVPSGAKHTTIRLTLEDHEAIHEISKALQAKNSDRTRANDILVDALWHFLKHTTGKTREDIRAILPPELRTPVEPEPQNKITVMPKSRKKR